MKTEWKDQSEKDLLPTRKHPLRPWAGLTRRTALLCLVAGLAASALMALAGSLDVGGNRGLKVYQGNAYIGTEYERVLTVDPSDITNLLATVTQVYQEILASDPPRRMEALAEEIAQARPDIAGLEELWTLEQAPATPQGPGEFTVVADYLQLLTQALAAKGAHYRVAVVASEEDVAAPMIDLATGGLAYGRVIDHDAILVRTDLPPGYLRVTNPQTGHFTNFLAIPSFGLEVHRGWCSVDVFIRGERFHFVCTHLEDEMSPEIQLAQGQELLAHLAQVKMPVMVVGDFNADSLHRNGTVTYDSFVQAGFKDTWLTLNPTDPARGLTWGHDPYLADPGTAFVWRIDFVWYRGNQFTPAAAEILDPRISLTQPPLWPSDHAALTASFFLGNPKAIKGKVALGNR